MPLAVSSGILGIHRATVTTWSRASGASPRSSQNAHADSNNASPIVEHATSAATFLPKARMPTRPLMAAPIPGSSGMSQIRSTSSFSRIPNPESPTPSSLPSHDVHFVDVDGFFVAIEGQDDSQTYGGLGRRDGDDEHCEHLTDGVLQLLGVGHQIDVHRIQNELDRHENDDEIPPH